MNTKIILAIAVGSLLFSCAKKEIANPETVLNNFIFDDNTYTYNSAASYLYDNKFFAGKYNNVNKKVDINLRAIAANGTVYAVNLNGTKK